MPRLLIDVTRLLYGRMIGRQPTGIDRVSVEYVRHFRAGARALLAWRGLSATLSAADSARIFELLLAPSAGVSRSLIAKACAYGWFPAGAGDCILFNTGHYGLDHRGYAALPRLFGARPVVVVHDLIPITHPQYCRQGERERHVTRMRNTLRMARGIVANSRYTLETLERFAAETRLPMPNAVIAPLAPALPAAARGPRPLSEPYFVMLGTIEPRKNHLLLLKLWPRLAERLAARSGARPDEAAPKLVVIGQRGWEYDDIVRVLEAEARSGRVIETGALPDAQVAAWLQHAQALVMPSHVEGYGLPVAEALAAGVPVIASELAVFREIAGAIPDYAAPDDEARWLELLIDYASPASAARQAQLGRLRGFRPATWSEHFAAVDAFLETLD